MAGISGFLQLHSAFFHHSVLLGHHRNYAHHSIKISSNKRSGFAVASLRQEESGDARVFTSRRALVFVGVVAVLPLLQLWGRAVESFPAADEQRDATISEEKKNEKVTQSDASSASPISSLLNVIGIISSGVLGALYASARQEQAASEAKIESLTKTLNDEEAAFKSVQKNYEAKLLGQQKEQAGQIIKAKNEQLTLITQLDSANNTITRLEQELQHEKKALKEVQAQADSLQALLSSVREDKKVLELQLKEKIALGEALQEKVNLLLLQIEEKEEQGQSLATSLSNKESELNELKVAYGRSTEELVKSGLGINKLEEEIRSSQKELELKNSKIADLSTQISALIVERDNSYLRINEMQKQYNDLKSDAEKEAELNAELIRDRDLDLAKFREKLDHALGELNGTKVTIANLTNERDRLSEMLHMEVNQVKNLKDELKSLQGSLDASRKEATESEEMLRKSRQLCTELETEVSKVQAELSEIEQTLHNSLDETKQSNALLAKELDSVNELLKKTIDEVQVVSNKLAVAQKINADLQKELVDVQKIAKDAVNELKEEKRVVDSLNKELQNLELEISKYKEARKSLETDLEETTKSLEQVNRNRQLLTEDLALAKSQISSLEEEKDVIYRSLAEQKNVTQATRENLEDAHNLVMRLGTDRENLDKKAKKLEEEFATAKGEILRLRSQVNSLKTSSTDKSPSGTKLSENGDARADSATVSVKKTTRRKKSSET
ncbi:hypothetical protein QQ045_016008 [Rhodiola kirilowii]